MPNIHHRKDYETGLLTLPDYRITCFFVDSKYRRKGVAALALRGALNLTASFLYGCTRSLFEQAGFSYDRPKGKNHCVMRTAVPRG